MGRRSKLLIRASVVVLLLGAVRDASARPSKPTPTVTPFRTATSTLTSTPTARPTSTPTPRATATAPPQPTATPVPPGTLSIVISEPTPGGSIASDRVNVRGTFTGPPNTGITVNDQI